MTDNGFDRALEHLRGIADGNGHTKGKLFEHLMLSYLKTAPLYRDRFGGNVWLWDASPKYDGRDYGIDIVAKDADGSWCAIQCKFYDRRRLTKKDIDSFLEAGSSMRYASMMLIYAGKGYGNDVRMALDRHNCAALSFESLAGSNVDWPDLTTNLTEVRLGEAYRLRDYQEDAYRAVESGFQKSDKGRMIMACGTGKTLTSIRIAERLVGKGGLVLYVVPSLSLMHQAIRYWSEQQIVPHSYIGVCSDAKVGRASDTPDIPIAEMEIGVTTDPDRIAASLRPNPDRMMVVFSTYHSMRAVIEAQERTGTSFDLVLCDEAHRTTGMEEDGQSPRDGSSFLLVHDGEGRLKARRRLYMTATPRVYTKATKTKAERANVKPYSMDNPDVYGDLFYNMSFSDAIELGLLSDYRVIVIGVSERYVGEAMQKVATTDAGDIRLRDAARMAGFYRCVKSPDPDGGIPSLRTSIVYTNRVRDSKRFAELLPELIRNGDPDSDFRVVANHVEGKHNATERAEKLQWLKSGGDDRREHRVLSNAKCLSEGVDVPALDSICFMNPKSSQIEIIQAVGRIMRKAEGKRYGYVVVPIGVPPDESPETVLDNNESYEIVWNILRALRSHDPRLDIEANMADLRKRMPERVQMFGISGNGEMRKSDGTTMPVGDVDIPMDAVYSRIVDEVGDRRYLEHWASDVADVVAGMQERIRVILRDDYAKAQFDSYMNGLREIIHDRLKETEGIEMLAQHMVTRRIFNAMFDSDDFAKRNPVSAVLDGVIGELESRGLDTELRDVEDFYRSVENRVAKLDSHDARQRVIGELYGTFFRKAFPKMADRLGIVYTPQEIVDFILRSVDHVLRENFGLGLTDEDINVIDPFTGAGTFMARLMSEDLGLINTKDLERKYHGEMFASEVVLLAYYIAAVNCESVYGQRTGAFKQFKGLSLTDTFNLGRMGEHVGDIMAEPKRRIRMQREAKIMVVVGNPPWSAGQKSANDDNQNVPYRELEHMVASTYIKRAPKGNKRALYNSYVLALRRASNMIRDGGVIGFVTPSSYMAGNSEAGIRACLEDEFTDVWCYNLRGDAMKSGEDRRREGDNMFGEGTRQGIAITILVKNPKKTGCTIHVGHMDDYLKVNQKGEMLTRAGSLAGISGWKVPGHNKYHDWVDPRGEEDEEFQGYMLMGNTGGGNAVFGRHSRGLATSRDAWAYNTSTDELERNMVRHIDYCNGQDLNNFVINPKRAKKNSSMIERMKKLGGGGAF